MYWVCGGKKQTAVYDGEYNSTTWNGKTYRLSELCEIINPTTCEILAVYNDDFYKDSPALTVNKFGKGKAYHIASNPEQSFFDDFCKMLSEEAELEKAMNADIPENISITYRRNGDKKIIFIQNFGDTSTEINVNDTYKDLITDRVYDKTIAVDGFSAVIVTKD